MLNFRLAVLALVSMMLVACGGAGPESPSSQSSPDAQEDGGAMMQSDEASVPVSTGDAAPATDAAPVVWCSPGFGVDTTRCSGFDIQTCGADGKWSKAEECPAANVCMAVGKSGAGTCAQGCPTGQILCCQVSACYCQSALYACD